MHVVHARHSLPSARFKTFIRAQLEQEAQGVLDGEVGRIGGAVAGAHLREGALVGASCGPARVSTPGRCRGRQPRLISTTSTTAERKRGKDDDENLAGNRRRDATEPRGVVGGAWALAFAAAHFYWGAGGTVGLGVDAAGVEARFARDPWPYAIAMCGVGGLFLAFGIVALALVRPRGRIVPRRAVLAAA